MKWKILFFTFLQDLFNNCYFKSLTEYPTVSHLECFRFVLILSMKYETREFCELHSNLSLYALNKTLLVYGHRYHSNTQERWAQGAILFCFTTSLWLWIICPLYIYQKYQHGINRPSLFSLTYNVQIYFVTKFKSKTFCEQWFVLIRSVYRYCTFKYMGYKDKCTNTIIITVIVKVCLCFYYNTDLLIWLVC